MAAKITRYAAFWPYYPGEHAKPETPENISRGTVWFS